MGELKRGSPLRIWAGENEKNETDIVAVTIYRRRLPKEAPFEQLRKSLVIEIDRLVKSKFSYSYWVSPKASRWLSG